MTLGGIAVPLKVGAAEVADVCMLTGIFDLIFCKCLCAQSINQCTNRILNEQCLLKCGIGSLQGMNVAE